MLRNQLVFCWTLVIYIDHHCMTEILDANIRFRTLLCKTDNRKKDYEPIEFTELDSQASKNRKHPFTSLL